MTIASCPNSGDDIAGIVHAVGSAVLDFKPGDRVAALHELGTKNGSYAEYAISYDWTTFHLDGKMTFEEGATVPMATYMAAIGLFAMLGVASGPWARVNECPVVVYGASSAVGAAAVRLAGIVGLHPLICVAGGGLNFVETLIDREKGDVTIDYRGGAEEVVSEIERVLEGRKLEYAFDAISENGSHLYFLPAMDKQSGNVTFVLGGHRDDIPEGIEQSTTMAGSLWKTLTPRGEKDKLGMGAGGKDFGAAYSKLITRWLQGGRLGIHPHELVDGGLLGLETALKKLRSGTSSAMKYVIRIADTPYLNV